MEIKVFFIPWYTLEGFKSALGDVSNDAILNPVKSGLTELVSNRDIKDMYVLNQIMWDTLRMRGEAELPILHNYNNGLTGYMGSRITYTDKVELINVLSEQVDEELFIMTQQENTIHIVAKQGFTRFLKDNDSKGFLKSLLEGIINISFDSYNSEVVYNSEIYRRYVHIR